MMLNLAFRSALRDAQRRASGFASFARYYRYYFTARAETV
jgi:hypothetical protein